MAQGSPLPNVRFCCQWGPEEPRGGCTRSAHEPTAWRTNPYSSGRRPLPDVGLLAPWRPHIPAPAVVNLALPPALWGRCPFETHRPRPNVDLD